MTERVAIHGTAQPGTIQRAMAEAAIDPAGAVVICDIEGGEFELFDDALLLFLTDANLIIETHEFLYKGEVPLQGGSLSRGGAGRTCEPRLRVLQRS